jgi:hypothetical protein
MSIRADYRANAEDCLRKAQMAPHAQEKPFWLNLAQSWLQLAQYSTQNRAEIDINEPGIGPNDTEPGATALRQTTRAAAPHPRNPRAADC